MPYKSKRLDRLLADVKEHELRVEHKPPVGTLFKTKQQMRRLQAGKGSKAVEIDRGLDKLAAANAENLQLWKSDCWAFLTGKDADGRPMVWTKDEGDAISPFKPFPAHPYLRVVLDQGLFGPQKVLLLDKCRQMMMSTLSCLAMYWLCLFHDGRKCFVSKTKEEQGAMLINDKIRGVHWRTPMWFQRDYPVSETPQNRILFPATESEIYAVTENAAVGEFRGNTVSIALVDEAAFQMRFPEMMQAAGPMASRIWAITTPNTGNPGADRFFELKVEGTR